MSVRVFVGVLSVIAGLLSGLIVPEAAQADLNSVTISTDTTWSDPGADYTYATIYVATGATLTVGPGVHVTLTGGGSNFLLRGNLVFAGSEQSKAKLTCERNFEEGVSAFSALSSGPHVSIDHTILVDCQRMNTAVTSVSHSFLLSRGTMPCISSYDLFKGTATFTDNVILNWSFLPLAGSVFQNNLFLGGSCIHGSGDIHNNYFATSSSDSAWTIWAPDTAPCNVSASGNYWGSNNGSVTAIEEQILDADDIPTIECNVNPAPVLLAPPTIPEFSPGQAASVQTGVAADPDTESVLLAGSADTDWALDLQVGIEYSTFADFSQGVTRVYADLNDAYGRPGLGASPFEVTADNLNPGTTYYFRAFARTDPQSPNHWGPSVDLTGSTDSFVTLGAKPMVESGLSTPSTRSATIEGLANANHLATDVSVEFSRSQALDSPSESAVQTVTGNTDSDLLFVLDSLEPGQRYFYRLKAVNSLGVVSGEVRSFTTLGDRPTVKTSGALPTPRSAQIQGQVNANHLPTQVRVEIGLDPQLASNSSLVTGPEMSGSQDESLTVLVDSLKPNTTYYYRIRAANYLGESLGETLSFKTSLDACSPDKETGVTVNDGSPYTNSEAVELRVRRPSCATGIRVSNDGSFDAPQTFDGNSPIDWILDNSVKGAYTKVVYVRLIGPGLEESQTYTDDIILDTSSPILRTASASQTGGVLSTSLADRGNRIRYLIRAKARDKLSGVMRMQVAPSKRGARTTLKYAKVVRVDLKRTKKLVVRVRDGAGNWSDWRSAKMR